VVGGGVPVTAEREYWFARRFPLGNPRSAMGPVHWKGWAITFLFVSILSAGGMAFAWLGASGQMVEGVTIFAATAVIAMGGFLTIVSLKSDKTRTVAEYRKAAWRA
jgi:hypothetical protein